MILAIKPRPTDNDLPIVKIRDAVDPEFNNPCETFVVVVNGEDVAQGEN